MDSDNMTAIDNWPPPKTVHQVRQFVGLASYYRRFIKDFARLSSPLTDLITGTEKFRKIDPVAGSRQSLYRPIKTPDVPRTCPGVA